MKLKPRQRRAWLREMLRARRDRRQGDLDGAFRHYERAHVLGQRNTFAHTRAHLGMFGVAWRRGDARELIGQALRVPAALTKSVIWVPRGNTGGADVSAFARMPVPADLQRFMD